MEAQKSLLVKGFSFSWQPKKFSYSDYLDNFELVYRSIDDLKILFGYNLDYIKIKIEDLALTVVLFEKNVYIWHIENIIDDGATFEKVKIKVNHEGQVNGYWNQYNNIFFDLYKNIIAFGSRPEFLYWLCKVHKTIANVCWLFKLYFWKLELLVINLQSF